MLWATPWMTSPDASTHLSSLEVSRNVNIITPTMYSSDHDDTALDRPHEECGVFGVYAPGEDVSRLTYFGLYALQHRGQESAGIAASDGKRLVVKRDMGLVSQVFDEESLLGLRGHLAIGHNRYSTTGSSMFCNAQPILLRHEEEAFALGHNGNLVNARGLRDRLTDEGVAFESTSDSEVIAQLIVASSGPTWSARIARSLPKLLGAYSLVMATRDAVFAARDPLGVRPLCLGRLGDGWVVASETCALDTIGAVFERDIAPGEMLRIDADGIHSHQFATPRPALCSFEYVYFARPDSVVDGQSVYDVRVASGRLLAREHPALGAEVVIPVPDSAIPAAVGYAAESGIPYGDGLIKNRYIGRTFISPDQRLRDVGIGLKFNPLPGQLAGRSVVVIEDSIVRGSTSKPIVQLIRKAGAREVHLRISSPPYRNPCYLGMDTGRREELIAARMSIEEIRQHIGADSLGYLSARGLLQAMRRSKSQSCMACLDGEYPLPVQMEMDKLALE